MRVLLSGVTNGTSSLGFGVSMLRLQTALLSAPGLQVTLSMAPSLPDAVTRASEGTFDALVAISSSVAFPPSFVLRGLVAPEPFVAGVHPLPAIDWDRVVAKAGVPGEDMRFKGMQYNVDPAGAKPSAAPGYMAVPSAGLRAVVLRSEAIQALVGKTGTDEELCTSWGKDILVDMDNQCAITGPLEFTGCVGFRAAPQKNSALES